MENYNKIGEALLARANKAAAKGNYELAAELSHRAASFYRKNGDEARAIQCENSARDYGHLNIDKEAVEARKSIAENTIRAAEIDANALNSSATALGGGINSGLKNLGVKLGINMQSASESLSKSLLQGAKEQADAARASGNVQAKATREAGE